MRSSSVQLTDANGEVFYNKVRFYGIFLALPYPRSLLFAQIPKSFSLGKQEFLFRSEPNID